MYSYSIYLANLLLREVLVQKVARPEGWAVAGLMTAAWLVATYGLSWLCYHGYESRMTGLRDIDLAGRAPARQPAAPAHRPATAWQPSAAIPNPTRRVPMPSRCRPY